MTTNKEIKCLEAKLASRMDKVRRTQAEIKHLSMELAKLRRRVANQGRKMTSQRINRCVSLLMQRPRISHKKISEMLGESVYAVRKISLQRKAKIKKALDTEDTFSLMGLYGCSNIEARRMIDVHHKDNPLYLQERRELAKLCALEENAWKWSVNKATANGKRLQEIAELKERLTNRHI